MTQPSSLAVTTEAWFLDEVAEVPGALVLRTPSCPIFRWGNFLYLDAPPHAGSRPDWEGRFEAAFADLPEVRHVTFAWSGEDGAYEEFVAAGYEGDRNTVRVATSTELAEAPAKPDGFGLRRVVGDDAWRTLEALQTADRDEEEPVEAYLAYRRQRTAAYRAIERGERPGLRGGWYVATIDGEPAGCMGVFARGDLGRFQHVYVAPAFRRRGVATAMVHAVAREGFERLGARRLVIMGDEGTQADRIYAGLGFRPIERYVGVCARDRAAVRGEAGTSTADDDA